MKNLEIVKESFALNRCTGCGACNNACPKGAISMAENREGFLSPVVNEAKCIECRICEKVCPVLNLNKENDENNVMYAVRARDDVRSLSSSGGIFSLVAEHILDKGGYVCGSAFDSDMKLMHRLISKKEELAPLRGSKYLQSDVGLIYKEIEALLKKGKTVFFVGTPCQVASLKNFLKKSYDRLYTADILCHGVPSQKSFDMYLSDISNGKRVTDVSFRSKRFGWGAEHILVTFENGEEYINTRRGGDPYVTAFLENMNLRVSCENCKFSESPRHGDISIGDFWGIERIDKTQNDGKGTSILLVNSKKGKELLKIIKHSATVNEYKYDKSLPNRLHSRFPASSQRHRFFELIDTCGFTGTVNEIRGGRDAKSSVLEKKFDVGLVCNYTAWNFGGSLTQYALFNVLEDMGYSTLLIERPKTAIEPIIADIRTQIYKKWPFDDEKTAPQFENKESMRALNNVCDSFVVGSDVLFRTSLYNRMGRISTLDWVNNDKRKIAYSASYGFDFLEGSYEDNCEMAYFMQQFDAFASREKSGVALFKNEFGVDSTWVLDPVFLCDKKHYDKIIENAGKENKSNYICAYILDPSEDKRKILDYCKRELNKDVEVFSEFSRDKNNLPGKELFSDFDHVNYTVEERLQSIKNCDFMVADSFHGICFALIYNKPFICIVNKARGATRFESLLGHFHAEDRMVESFEDVLNKPHLLQGMSYSEVNGIIENEVARCKDWLRDALTKPKKVGYSLYDVMHKLLLEKDKEIDILKRQVQVLYSQINNLPRINNVDGYLNELKRVRDHSTIIVSVKDTPGIELSEEYGEKIKDCLGSEINLAGKHQQSYLFISHNSRALYESLEQGVIRKNINIAGFNISCVSAALRYGNIGDIFINGKNYSTAFRGLNIVVIDNLSGTVVDSVCLDTHLVPYTFTRNNKDIL